MPSDSCDHHRTTAKPHHFTTSTPGAPPPEPEHLPCPRCDSTNTKFCYYNNYNFSQPRHFCKSCRRYWTHGGTLRDIPVGGSTRKNAKRSRLSTSANTLYNSSSTLEFRHMAPPNAAPILLPFAGEHGLSFGKPAMSMCESFTALLNSTQGPAGFFGFEDGRPVWPFSGIGDGGFYAAVGGGGRGGGNMTWHMESGEGGGGGECFTLPDLMI